MSPKGTCRRCGKLVEARETAAYAIQGYEVERDGGGQNHVRAKKRLDGWIWHARYNGDCFDQVVSPQAKQEALI